jgi:deferrochelatase/peroxidase EfeB
MSHALVTIAAPIAMELVSPATAAIAVLENPAHQSIRQELDRLEGDDGTHFMSMHAIPSGDGSRGHLILEFSADGSEDEALARITAAIGPVLENIFKLATDWRPGTLLLGYLSEHRVHVGHGYFSNPGIAFAGTPGMSVGRIRKEYLLANRIARILDEQGADIRAIDRLADVRARLRSEPDHAWALESPVAPLPRRTAPSFFGLVLSLLLPFARAYLWPFGLVVLAVAIYCGAQQEDWAARVMSGLAALVMGVVASIVLVVLILGVLFLLLRRAEKGDWLEERAADHATLAEILKRENRAAQNHMVSVTRRKPGLVRWLAIRVVFWIVGQLVARVYRPGHLGDIGSIHFARWVTLPGTRDFVFFSNYGGSWESYLEDFITRAHNGLTAIWSNSIGFPRSENLFQKGATDGERFKRYARWSMLPTPFWYSAYPSVTTAHIRTNASIRRGLAAAMTNEEAERWLALFGSAQRPASKLESSDIQSLVFGGLGFMPFGTCLLFRLGEEAGAKEWIARLIEHVAFNDGRRLRRRAVITLGLGPHALAKLGLPEECVKGFPAAFLDGMATAARAQILGDLEDNAVEHWWWGKDPADAALLLYGRTERAVDRLRSVIGELATRHGQTLLHEIPLKPITSDKREPFGFADGISQPFIRGTYKGVRRPGRLHGVEPGEFVLGYPDNRGNIPPGPRLSPLLDPHNRLPIAGEGDDFATNIVDRPRDVGRNGTFLVIRQLEQDVARFEDYCEQEALRLRDRFTQPHYVTPEFIGAKMVGRWKDGSSLARFPYTSASEDVLAKRRLEAAGKPRTPDASPPPSPDVRPDNEFFFGREDPEALRCPFGSHIRRANPRDSLAPDSDDQIEITNRHRILRVGRFYRPKDGQKPGLLFMCLNGDLERQFEFVQQTWLASPTFHGLVGELDPIVGDGGKDATGFAIPTRDGPVRLRPLPRFVATRGGGYFFMPGRRLLAFLGGDR